MLFFSFKLSIRIYVRSIIACALGCQTNLVYGTPLFGFGFINIDSNFRIR